uniref:Uncharacterized protein n=1 Tax=Ignisphaera aggregans TaxID=334771 RepID=A0A7C2V8T7_9CREN
MSSYEKYVEELLKLQRCYRVQNILATDIASKIDMLSRPRVALTLSIALWCVRKLKQSILSYSDVVYLQRRTARFLAKGEKKDVEIIKKLFELIPMRYGMNVTLAARRCNVSETHLVEVVRALNLIRDIIDMVTIGPDIKEPIRHSYTLCLNDVDLLPPTASNPEEYLRIIIDSLSENLDRIADPILQQVARDICEEARKQDNIKENDIAAIALITKLISDAIKPNVICAEPSINIEALSQRLLNDLALVGVAPYDSPFYNIYQEVSMRRVVHGTQK